MCTAHHQWLSLHEVFCVTSGVNRVYASIENPSFAFAAAMHERFLTKHILASSDGIQPILLMERVRGANEHHVHFWIRIGFFVTAVYGRRCPWNVPCDKVVSFL
jgi:hypothetical protein